MGVVVVRKKPFYQFTNHYSLSFCHASGKEKGKTLANQPFAS
jgi:hypothetical protein